MDGDSSGETHVDDAFGAALQEYHQGEGPGKYTTERDDGHEVSADIAHYFDPYEQWEQPTKQAMDYIRPGDKVLDVGCGSGRHALWLQERGHEVVAIDRSEKAIEICRDRGIEACEVMDMTDLQFDDDEFDTILVVGNIIGLGGSLDGVRGYFEEFDRITTDRGRVIADSQNPFPEGVEETAYFRENQIDGRNASNIRFRVHYRNLVENWLEIAMIGEDELAEIIADTPWSITDIIETEPGEGWYSVAMQWYFAVVDKTGE